MMMTVKGKTSDSHVNATGNFSNTEYLRDLHLNSIARKADSFMEGIERIIDHITSTSLSDCEYILDSAELECDRIRKEFSKTIESEHKKIVAAGKNEAQRRLQRLCNLAELESKKQVLATQQEMLCEVFKLAAESFRLLPQERYISFLVQLMCDAVFTGNEKIMLSSQDKTRIGATLCKSANAALNEKGINARLKLSEETADISGGFLLIGDGVVTDCSTDVLISMRRNELTQFAAEQLFD